MIVGLARVSTCDQKAGLDVQLRDLRAAGCERVFAEEVSAVGKREQLRAMMEFVRDGDTVVVTRADRLARSTADLLGIVAELERKQVGLRILTMGGSELDTRSPTGRLLLTMLAAIAEFERTLMLERQREGISRAKQEGRYRGRTPTARRQIDAVRALHAQDVGPSEIARRLSISRSSVHAMLKEVRTAASPPRPSPGG
jgi:DNA invertase Pin-like site-specific DNA recombinase